MLLHAESTSVTPSFSGCTVNFNLPHIELDEHKYTIGVRTIYVEFKEKCPSSYMSLRSTVVDRNVFNPEQELYSFRTNGSNYFFEDVFMPKHYKIQISNLNTSEFKLHTLHAYQVRKIRIIFELIRDARIQ